MTLSIRTVKREIRILGLDTCRKGEVFGAVVRGGLFLDGVIRLGLPRKQPDRELARGILAAKYYPELRAIMLHDPGLHLDPDVLEKLANLPVMGVSRVRGLGAGYTSLHSGHGTIYHRSHLSRSTMDKILSLTWSYGGLPEPARLAHVLARGRWEGNRPG